LKKAGAATTCASSDCASYLMIMGIQPGLGLAHKVASGEADAVMNSIPKPGREEPSRDIAPPAIEVAVSVTVFRSFLLCLFK
jgi:hypothetical protein